MSAKFLVVPIHAPLAMAGIYVSDNLFGVFVEIVLVKLGGEV